MGDISMRTTATILLASTMFAAGATGAWAADSATAKFTGADGTDHGTLTLTSTPNGVLITGELTNVPAGAHGFHFHTTGACEPPFESAGGHFNPTEAEHGFLVEAGPHSGDMTNLHAGDSGTVTVETVDSAVSLTEGEEGYLLDEDGTSLILHAGADDYQTQPSGASGDRIACAVVE
jgi:superoxide dismutase, Cu-Zn family